MTDEERDIITHFIERVSGAARPLAGPSSVPTTITPLPPVDPDADRLIGDLFQRYPEARYRLTQTAFVQEHALAEAQSRIAQLQAELQSRSTQQPQGTAPSGGGFFHNLFGGGQPQGQQPPPSQPYQPYPQQPYAPQQQYAPQPQYAQPQYAPQPGMFQRSGSGFLGSALTTAAGVAGGVIAGNALMNLFEGNRGFGGGGFGGGGFGSGGGFDQGYAPGVPDAQVSGSAWDNATEDSTPAGWGQGAAPDTGGTDSGWDAGNSGDAGGGDSGGGWDDGSGGGSF